MSEGFNRIRFAPYLGAGTFLNRDNGCTEERVCPKTHICSLEHLNAALHTIIEETSVLHIRKTPTHSMHTFPKNYCVNIHNSSVSFPTGIIMLLQPELVFGLAIINMVDSTWILLIHPNNTKLQQSLVNDTNEIMTAEADPANITHPDIKYKDQCASRNFI